MSACSTSYAITLVYTIYYLILFSPEAQSANKNVPPPPSPLVLGIHDWPPPFLIKTIRRSWRGSSEQKDPLLFISNYVRFLKPRGSRNTILRATFSPRLLPSSLCRISLSLPLTPLIFRLCSFPSVTCSFLLSTAVFFFRRFFSPLLSFSSPLVSIRFT